MTRSRSVLGLFRSLSWQALRPEGLGVLGTAVPALNGFAILWLLAAQRLLPPATPVGLLSEIRDPAFLNPVDWAVLVALVVAAATAYLTWWPPQGWGFRADQIETPARRSTLIGLLILTGLWIVIGGDPVFMLLSAPAVLWLGIRPRGPGAGRTLNLMLWVGGLLPWVGGCLVLASALPTPAFVWWHLFAAAAYGVIPVGQVLAWVLLMALAVRFLRLAIRAG